ncbi:SDR family NAD(P)-dependent oxidoreductase [Litoribrevibacter albus]|uniref:3-oxoacyl-ACP reductase n=1 Tax=Litoribrevibacter albus TaxID=1473156 RepID=A0AA37S8Y4_9GAMM|nr:SDR family NAD(P)-dependent oxidoreductase [Litoribrevibacter albus]GLQ30609.1 3-oxoacyl-ACP reductase [Litoribrevibacter albus]
MSKTCLITGAARGIGRALAVEMAKHGYLLALTGRNQEQLAEVREEIVSVNPSAHVEIYVLDVTDYPSVFDVISVADQSLGGLDIVIANAGISVSKPVGVGGFEAHKSVIETNVLGLMATAEAILPFFKERNAGQFVAISSVAAFRGLPNHSSYCASKVAVKSYMESLSMELIGSKVLTTTLFPGYIDTDINKHMASRPFLISAEQGAKEMLSLIQKGVKVSTVPKKPWSVVSQLMKAVPESVLAKLS